MKNLKKILSLSLALVMLMGMMVIAPASAADEATGYAALVDKDEIVNVEAVALLVDLGIIEGKPGKDGNVYDPTGIVDRATMAKLVTLLHFANDSVDQFKGTVTNLTDVPAGHWAESYIKYCYSQGIIAGDGLGNFNPSNQVTVAAAAKMLLVALGYDADKAGLVGADWSINTMKLASNAGMFNGMSVAADSKLTRDDVALMMYNTLFANEVAYNMLSGNDVVVKTNTLGLKTYGLVAVTGLVTAAGEDEVSITTTTVRPSTTQTLAAFTGSYDYALGNQEHFVGQTATIYVRVDTKQSTEGNSFVASTIMDVTAKKIPAGIISSEMTLAENTALKTASAGKALSALTKKGGDDYIISLDASYDLFWNGIEYTSTYTTGDPDGADLKTAIATKGTIVTFIDTDGNNKADVINVMSYVPVAITAYKSGKSGTLTLSTSIKATKADGTYEATRSAKWDAEDVIGFENFAKDDVVYGYVYNDKLYLTAATMVEGEITAIPSDKKTVTVDGTKYTFAMEGTANYNIVSASKFFGTGDAEFKRGTEAEFYLDSTNKVIGMKVISTGDEPFLMVSWVYAAGRNTQEIEAFFTDGTENKITVYQIDSTKVSDGAALTSSNKNEIYTYSENSDGNYRLTSIATPGDFITTNTLTIKAKDPTVLVSNGSKLTLSSDSIVVDTKTNKVYTGFNEIKNIDNAKGVASLDGTKIEVLFLTDGSFVSDDSSYVIIYDVTAYSEGGKDDGYYLFKAVIDGEIEDADGNTNYIAVAKTPAMLTLVQSTNASGAAYVVKTTSENKDGTTVVESFDDAKTIKLKDAVVATTASGSVIATASTSLSVDDETVFLTFESNKTTLGDSGEKFSVSEGGSLSDITVGTTKVIVKQRGDDKVADYVIIVNPKPVA